MACELVERAKALPDHRRRCRNLKHRLGDLVVLGFRGVPAGGADFVELADWARQHVAFFRTPLELPPGIPSPDTFNRTLATVKPATLQEVLLPWLLERRGPPGEWIHLDGEALRHTRRKAAGLGASHVVSARAGQTGLTLGQVAVEAKSDESTAPPQLLELLDSRAKIVTTDAMGRQKDIARGIVEHEGDYVLAVKDNQPAPHAESQAAFATAEARPGTGHRQ